jgi:hypothetical protein
MPSRVQERRSSSTRNAPRPSTCPTEGCGLPASPSVAQENEVPRNRVDGRDGSAARAPDREIHESCDPVLRHASDEISHQHLLDVVLLRRSRAERGEHGVLTVHGAIDRCRIARLALDNTQALAALGNR